MKKGIIIGLFFLMGIAIGVLGVTVINQNKELKEIEKNQEEQKEQPKILTEEEATKLFHQRYEKDLIDAENLSINEDRLIELAKDICKLEISEYPVSTCLTKERVYQEYPNFTEQFLSSTESLKHASLTDDGKIMISGNGRVKSLDYIRPGNMEIKNITENKIEYLVEHVYCAEMSQNCKTSGNERTEKYNYILEKRNDSWLVSEIGLPY